MSVHMLATTSITNHLPSLIASAQVVFMATTPYLCSSASNGCVQTLNNEAFAIMEAYGVPVISAYDAIINQCGGEVPVQSCFGETGCYCPHCTLWEAPPVSSQVAENVLSGCAHRSPWL